MPIRIDLLRDALKVGNREDVLKPIFESGISDGDRAVLVLLTEILFTLRGDYVTQVKGSW